jgi:hypothetical protein
MTRGDAARGAATLRVASLSEGRVVHTLVDTVAALLEQRVEGTLTMTALSVQTANGSHRLYQRGATWHAVGRGHSSRVPDWLAEFLYPLLTEGLGEQEKESA